MTHRREYCPKCKTIHNMRMTLSHRDEVDSDGKKQTIKTQLYHCEVCQSFVYSEDLKEK